MTGAAYTVRYRLHTRTDAIALLVEDESGDVYLFDGQALRPYLRPSDDPARRLVTLHRLGWVRVPHVAPYTLDELHRLLGTTVAA